MREIVLPRIGLFEYFGKNTGLVCCTILQYVLFRQRLKRTSGRGYVKDSGIFLRKKTNHIVKLLNFKITLLFGQRLKQTSEGS